MTVRKGSPIVERIEAAAISLDGVVWSVPRPGRHHDVIQHVLRKRPELDFVGGAQGFVTSTGRFVGRYEAKDIARAADQIIASEIGPGGVPFKRQYPELFSEDVW